MRKDLDRTEPTRVAFFQEKRFQENSQGDREEIGKQKIAKGDF
jgi:hypothetical protein